MAERYVPVAVEYEVTAHLRDIELLRMPELPSQHEPDIAGHDTRWRDREETPPLKTQMAVTQAPGIGKPEVRMPQGIREALEVVRAGKRDDCNPPVGFRDLLFEFSQLREVLLAEESTKVSEEDQNRWAPKQSAGVKDLAIESSKVEAKIYSHRVIIEAALMRRRYAHAGDVSTWPDLRSGRGGRSAVRSLARRSRRKHQ